LFYIREEKPSEYRITCDMCWKETEKTNLPLTRMAVGENMINNGEGANGGADPIIHVMYLAGHCYLLG
jgi:hypothetical protein